MTYYLQYETQSPVPLSPMAIVLCSQGQKLVFYMYELLVSHLEQLTRPYRQEVDDLMTCLEKCGLRALRIGQKVSAHTRITIEEVRRVKYHDLLTLNYNV